MYNKFKQLFKVPQNLFNILIPLTLLCHALNEPSLNFTLLFLLKNFFWKKDMRHFSNDIAHFSVFIERGSVLKRFGFFGICQP